MREIIKDSTLWGRVRTAVIFAFTSKYSLSLYELLTARINLTLFSNPSTMRSAK